MLNSIKLDKVSSPPGGRLRNGIVHAGDLGYLVQNRIEDAHTGLRLKSGSSNRIHGNQLVRGAFGIRVMAPPAGADPRVNLFRENVALANTVWDCIEHGGNDDDIWEGNVGKRSSPGRLCDAP